MRRKKNEVSFIRQVIGWIIFGYVLIHIFSTSKSKETKVSDTHSNKTEQNSKYQYLNEEAPVIEESIAPIEAESASPIKEQSVSH